MKRIWPAEPIVHHDVLSRIAELPHTRVHELLSWNWKAARDQALAASAGSHLTPRLRTHRVAGRASCPAALSGCLPLDLHPASLLFERFTTGSEHVRLPPATF